MSWLLLDERFRVRLNDVSSDFSDPILIELFTSTQFICTSTRLLDDL